MTSEIILHVMKFFSPVNVSIHRNTHQTQFINECARKNLAKIQETHHHVVTASHSFCEI